MQDVAQSMLRIGIELTGHCDSCLDRLGKSAARHRILGQQLRQRVDCGALIHGQNGPLLA